MVHTAQRDFFFMLECRRPVPSKEEDFERDREGKKSGRRLDDEFVCGCWSKEKEHIHFLFPRRFRVVARDCQNLLREGVALSFVIGQYPLRRNFKISKTHFFSFSMFL